MVNKTIPINIMEYGTHNEGAQVELVTCPSTHASTSKSHVFVAKKAKKRQEMISITTTLTRFRG
jgi:hypothetical protein